LVTAYNKLKESVPADLTYEEQFILLLARGSLSSHMQEQACALLAKPLDW
jgi:hypothetical protein